MNCTIKKQTIDKTPNQIGSLCLLSNAPIATNPNAVTPCFRKNGKGRFIKDITYEIPKHIAHVYSTLYLDMK